MTSHGFRRRALFHGELATVIFSRFITYFRNVFFVSWLSLDVIRTEVKIFSVFLFISM